MALNSPGVQVTVVDESFYTPAAPATVPLIIVASGQDKQNASGTGTAKGTLKTNAGQVYLITSQRDLTDTFGTPVFYTDASGNPVNGGELNEYGLQAAYSLLGVSASAYVTRADLNLTQLVPSSSEPDGAPVDGTYWLDTSNTTWGVFEWNATTQAFVNKVPTVIDDSNSISATTDGYTPKPSFGSNGSYAVVATKNNDTVVWYKNTLGTWVPVGSEASTSTFTFGTSWDVSFPAVTSTATNSLVSNNGHVITINGQSITLSGTTVSALATSINNVMHTKGVGAKAVGNYIQLYASAYAKSNGTDADGKIAVSEISTQSSILEAIGIPAGTYENPQFFQGPHTAYPDFSMAPSGSVYMKTTSPNYGASWFVKLYSATTEQFTLQKAGIYQDPQAALIAIDPVAAGLNVPVGGLYIENMMDQAEFVIYRRSATGPTKVTSAVNTNTVGSTSTITISEGTLVATAPYSSPVSITVPAGSTMDQVIALISNAGLTYVTASAATTDANGDATSLTIQHSNGGEIVLTGSLFTGYLGMTPWSRNGSGVESGTRNFYSSMTSGEYEVSNWKPLVVQSLSIAPVTTPADGQLWYSSVVDEVDIMVHNGSHFVGYRTVYPGTDPMGPIVASLAPTTQQDGVTALANGDIWISTADIETYGHEIYVYNGNTLSWVAQDVTDHTTPNGWIFADARWATNGYTAAAADISDLLLSNYVDPDSPDPALYPKGTRLWNTRRSGFNVKKYVANYINIYSNSGLNLRYNNEHMDGSAGSTPYLTARWVSDSPNNADGSGTFGRHAQRSVVVKAMKALIDTNSAIRDTDSLVFNLIACPGYPEAIQNLVAFNTDRGQTAFVIGDTPFRLPSDGTSLHAWGLNSNGALDNNDIGAVSYDDYMAMFYPSGYTNDNTGNYIVVPPSHMMLRTIANSDAKSYQWFAPAGLRRGVVDNATAVGYIDSVTGEFTRTTLPQSIRDVLAGVKINPIATLTGAGIVNFGQYTRANAASSMDRINVARLVAYIRRQLSLIVKPYLFEPNDALTRGEVKNAIESFFLELVAQRGVNDFIVVCDTSNNTPTRIDRSELWIDIAMEPVKAVEFIYIPVRLLNTGAIAAGNLGSNG
jgi:Phage tail sheath C-terminal domain